MTKGQLVQKKLGENKAELYLDSIMVIFVVFLALAIAISVLPVVVYKQEMDILVKEAARYVEVRGSTDGLGSEIDRLSRNMGLVPDSYDIEGEYSNSSEIQLRETFTIEMEKKVYIGYGGSVGIPINLTSTASGRSEVYWK